MESVGSDGDVPACSRGRSRRWRCGVLLVVLAFGLTGCGGGDSSPPPANGPDTWDNMKWDQGNWS